MGRIGPALISRGIYTRKGQPPKGSKKGKRCETRYCRNLKAVMGGYLRSFCWKCKSRQLKDRQPATYFFNTLRHSARKRGLSFSLTLKEFKAFCEQTNFLRLKGKKPDDATIDRIDGDRGYSIDNIRVLSHGENSRQGKYNLPRYLRAQIDNTHDEQDNDGSQRDP